MTANENIHIVIPTYNRAEFLVECIESIYRQTYKNFKIIVVDDNSSDNTPDILRLNFPEVVMLLGTGNLWWAGATNMGCEFALKDGAQLILTLNDDLIIDKYYLEQMIKAHLKHPDALIGSLSISLEDEPRLLYAGIISHNYWTTKTRNRGNLFSIYKFDFRGLLPTITLPGRGTLIPKNVFEKIGLFDSKSFPQYAADYDFSIRAKKNGFELYINSEAILYSRFKNTGIGNISDKEVLYTFLKSFFTFKSPNFLPKSFIFNYKHHPLKIYFPIYFTLLVFRKIISYLLRGVSIQRS